MYDPCCFNMVLSYGFMAAYKPGARLGCIQIPPEGRPPPGVGGAGERWPGVPSDGRT